MMSFDEDRKQLLRDESKTEAEENSKGKLVVQGGRGQRTVYIAGIGYRYYTYTLTS